MREREKEKTLPRKAINRIMIGTRRSSTFLYLLMHMEPFSQ